MKTRISARLGDDIDDALNEALAKKGLSSRKRSAWVSEALRELLARGVDSILAENILIGRALGTSEATGVTKAKTFVFDDDLYLALVDAVARIRQRDPYLPAAQSTLIRAAILERLGRHR